VYTRCPACQAVYELPARVLAEAAGVVRCGNCGKTFNSLSELFEQHPDEDSQPLRGQGMPPLLEHPDMVQAELPVGYDDPIENAEAEFDGDIALPPPEDDDEQERRWLWPGVSAALFVLLLLQFVWMGQTPGSPVAGLFGGASGPDSGLDPNETIQIVSRDLHAHPSLDDAVVVSASLRNQADTAVPFPVIEVRFYDASQQVLGVRRLRPEEYLRDSETIEAGLPAGIMMPVLLEFVVGTSTPAGFQMRFY
jgi:predicted Zn finger-like uncharacterized protein